MTCPKCSGRMFVTWVDEPPACLQCGYYYPPADVLGLVLARRQKYDGTKGKGREPRQGHVMGVGKGVSR
jgi:hypothetical protein